MLAEHPDYEHTHDPDGTPRPVEPGDGHCARLAERYVVVAGNAHFGPFETLADAHAWTVHPDRTVEVREYRVAPLFGGLFLAPLTGPVTTTVIGLPGVYPGVFGLTPTPERTAS
jgi:hypothetical protein